jgi:RimJ/RimL family protein N-acetyltransferase
LESERLKLTVGPIDAIALTSCEAILHRIGEHAVLREPPDRTVRKRLDTFVEGRIRANPTCILFAVFDKAKATPGNADGELAGTIGLLNTSTANLVAEIGVVLLLLAVRRAHVTSNAIGLLLRYA